MSFNNMLMDDVLMALHRLHDNPYRALNKENVTPSALPTRLVYQQSPRHQFLPPLPTRVGHQVVPAPPAPPVQVPAQRLGEDFYRKANSKRTKRLVTVAQMYFLDYYCDMFDYVILRRERQQQVEAELLKLPSAAERELQWRLYVGRERALLRKRRIRPQHKDFDTITQVGQGGYGEVYLARKRDTREICALKVLNKRVLVRSDEARHVLTERDILTNTRLEWLVKLLYAFQDTQLLFLAMEFVPGGDYRTLLMHLVVLKPPHARFYLLEMFAAVNALHELGYTHRDLKPENFLIDATGHIKLTDFGLAAGTVLDERIELMRIRLDAVKELQYHPPLQLVLERQKAYRLLRLQNVYYANLTVGLPDYMALEVLERKNYDFTIDYWSLGCMLFETLVGYTPFSGHGPDATYHNLRRWREALQRPRDQRGRPVFSDRTWQLITKLIALPLDRLRLFAQVQRQPYFADVDWVGMRTRPPPFVPLLDLEEDAGYFDDFENEADMNKYKDVKAKQEQAERAAASVKNVQRFIGFTFKHKGNPNNSTSGILEPIVNRNSDNTTLHYAYDSSNVLGTLY